MGYRAVEFRKGLLCSALVTVAPWAMAEDLGTISITATREERATAEVPQAIAVVGKEQLADKKMLNVKEGLQEIPGVLVDSKNGGNDARLIIRGAGLKAPYGIREIMVLRDGVPLSDPDSFTRLDFVDTQDIERIEVAKGPGNLFATGAVGGAIQIISRSVFDKTANNLKIGLGNFGAENYHVRYGEVGENQALAVTASRRTLDNDWRLWNKFDTTQTSVKHGLMFKNGDVLESEISYSDSNIQLPGAMDKTLFDKFVDSGKQNATSEPWKNSGRYSKVWFFNSRYEMERGNVTFKPRVYFNTWYHYHPVTGFINETQDWVRNIGTDLETDVKHRNGSIVAGLTLREEKVPDSRKYTYRDVTTTSTGRILSTLSDDKGSLAETSNSTSLLTGVYAQESWRPTDRWIIDAGFRYDVVNLKDDTTDFITYNYAAGTYSTLATPSDENLDKTFILPAPKLGVTYKLNDYLHLFGVVAQAGQIPDSSEISNNPNLDAPISRNYEVGLKGRAVDWQFDVSVYVNPVENEIVQVINGGITEYANAGDTDKKGLELSGSYNVAKGWKAGAYYSYSDYTYKHFTEPVRTGATTVNIDRSGNHLPFVPTNQYGIFAVWRSPSGWHTRISSNSWGEYWLDNANTQKYEGWKWVTNLAVGYEKAKHALTLNVDNIFDKHYAFEVKKDTSGKVTYTAASPRTTMLTYGYRF